MSMNKRVKKSMFLVCLGAVAVFVLISLWGIFAISSALNEELDYTSSKITDDNTADMLDMSFRLAQSTAKLNARRISGGFTRVRGELETLKGDIENLYNCGGVNEFSTDVSRYEEYVVSQGAPDLTQEEIDKTVQIMGGSVDMFNNVLENDPSISFAYVVLENGVVFSCSDTFYPDVEKADMRTRDWYKNAIKKGDVAWAELYQGMSGKYYITVACPVYDKNTGEPFGVVAFDFRAGDITDEVLVQNREDFADAYIQSESGKILLSTQPLEETVKPSKYTNYVSSVDKTGLASGCYTTDDSIAGFADIEETGWRLVVLLDYNEVLEPVEKIATTVSNVSTAMSDDMTTMISAIGVMFLAALVVVALVASLISRRIAKGITGPVEALAAGAKEIGSGNIDYVIPDLGEDEIGGLAKSFNNMTAQLREYIDNLTAVTAEKERIGAELDVATHIQKSMLPAIFPHFIDQKEYSIFATMDPAKEVGGDFYDFFMVDERHLAIVVADVSGKGVPAALFMVIGKTLINDHTNPGHSLSDVFTKVNDLLCASNSEGLFITAFEGVLDLDTGDLEFVNAGHEMPFIMKKGEGFVPQKIRPGFVLAGMEGIRYKAGHLKLEPGDRFFQYTDGVTEATSASLELFGMDRLEKSLNEHRNLAPEPLLTAIKADIDGFVGEAPQFDDITMLCVDYFGPKGKKE